LNFAGESCDFSGGEFGLQIFPLVADWLVDQVQAHPGPSRHGLHTCKGLNVSASSLTINAIKPKCTNVAVERRLKPNPEVA
jgi:hypothetical protein